MQVAAKYRGRLEPGMLDYIRQLPEPPAHALSIDEQRRYYGERCAQFAAPRAAGVTTHDETLAGEAAPVHVRTYTPAREPHGCVLYIHGGGWVLGDLDSHDDICSELAAHTGASVIAVDYRRVPEHTHPAAFDDCCAVLDHVRANPTRFGTQVVVAGDSAGGNLAAALALKVRDVDAPPLAGQALVYPLLCADQSLASYDDVHDAPLFTRIEAVRIAADYLGERPPDEYAFPLLARDFTGLAPACVCVAELDPLRDDGIEYTQLLKAVGTSAELLVGTGLTHAFLRARHMSVGADAAFRSVCSAIDNFLR